jgi:tRNA threonylcarbamoyladenosine biosynthesis protein TsaB
MTGLNILALDSACAACSAALLRRDGSIVGRFQAMTRGHAEALIPMAVAVLDEAGLGFDALELVAVTVGPGSFTGIRTGIAAAQGIALARDIPLFGVTTLEAVGHAAAKGAMDRGEGGDLPILVALETRRADLYVQWFSPALDPLGAAEAASTAGIAAGLHERPFVAAGDGIARLRDTFGNAEVRYAAGPGLPDAADVAALAAARWPDRAAAGASCAGSLRPLYLHPPQATPARDGGRIRP